ncbi:MAG TPA: hypothetical protein VGM92_11275 [Candidatus Kapabacteria bacterium]|jgi:hypothetical protein
MDASLKKFRVVLAFLLSAITLFAINGCNPYEFALGGPHTVSCEILTPLAGVDHGPDHATLRNGAAIDLNYFGATQYLISMGLRLNEGTGCRILLRPVVEYRDVRDSGMILTLTSSGISIDPAHQSMLLHSETPLAPHKVTHLWILSQNNFTQVVLDCDTVFRGWTKRNESDDVVIEALPKSEVDIIQPDWASIPGE